MRKFRIFPKIWESFLKNQPNSVKINEKSLKITGKSINIPWIEDRTGLMSGSAGAPCKPSTRAMSRCWATSRASKYIQPVRRTAPGVTQTFFGVITYKTSVFYENHDILNILTLLDSSKKKTLIYIQNILYYSDPKFPQESKNHI